MEYFLKSLGLDGIKSLNKAQIIQNKKQGFSLKENQKEHNIGLIWT